SSGAVPGVDPGRQRRRRGPGPAATRDRRSWAIPPKLEVAKGQRSRRGISWLRERLRVPRRNRRGPEACADGRHPGARDPTVLAERADDQLGPQAGPQLAEAQHGCLSQDSSARAHACSPPTEPAFPAILIAIQALPSHTELLEARRRLERPC